MAVNLNATSVEVFKFKETGAVALCQEVADLAWNGDLARWDLDESKAYFAEDEQVLKVVFPR